MKLNKHWTTPRRPTLRTVRRLIKATPYIYPSNPIRTGRADAAERSAEYSRSTPSWAYTAFVRLEIQRKTAWGNVQVLHFLLRGRPVSRLGENTRSLNNPRRRLHSLLEELTELLLGPVENATTSWGDGDGSQ